MDNTNVPIITDEMVDAGRKALSDSDSGFWSRGGTTEKELLMRIFVSMQRAAKR